jgi:dolichyl-phosphate-mannose-protein mannosyltransferase
MTTDTAPRAGALRWVVPLLLLVVAGAVRFAGLDQPERIYFDETYYVEDAGALLDRGVEEGFAVHPPVGKWLVAAGIALLGDNPFGWRAASAAAGTLTVLFVYLAGLRLFRHRGPAALAGLLVAFDGLALTMSRIAMLDAALTLFVAAAFWLLLIDRDVQWRGVPEHPPDGAPDGEPPGLPSRPRWARWLAGLALGVALATKWSAVLAIGAAGLLVLGSELAFRRRTTGQVTTGWPRLVAAVGLPLVLLPAAVYVLSYGGWFASYELTRPGVERCPDPDEPCAVALPTRVADWVGEQREIARFHLQLDADHPYRASALTWPTLARPIAYYYESCTPEREAELAAEGQECAVERGNVAHVLGMGNPALFWLALPGYGLLLWFGVGRRDWRALAISAFLLGQYVPWLAAARPVFFFYAAPLVPFVALAVAYAAWRALAVPALRWVPAAVAALVVGAFVFWYPLYAGLEIPHDAWNLRIWTNRWV